MWKTCGQTLVKHLACGKTFGKTFGETFGQTFGETFGETFGQTFGQTCGKIGGEETFVGTEAQTWRNSNTTDCMHKDTYRVPHLFSFKCLFFRSTNNRRPFSVNFNMSSKCLLIKWPNLKG